MKKSGLIILCLILTSILISPAYAKDNRYSYITFESVNIQIEEERATLEINYSVEDTIQIIVLLLGKADLKKKLYEVFPFENSIFESVDMDHAVLVVSSPSLNNGDGSLWFPRIEIGAEIPEIEIKTPRSTRNFNNSSEIPGIGYFAKPIEIAIK
ncbi:hypothetical protein [Methanoplanus endosymbiosus]|uniref:Uncharacterized protein n=1 Tax=Methanoplanus endosymbiosus TaxID=33865 RepID=A0A9E7PLH3_9EURY|nr:hypothetical protein [Methanoplanus endosymbiosus]UUX92360.1 hypothetical protein L6E24_13640 [Methanoplanus endosymbiosus]